MYRIIFSGLKTKCYIMGSFESFLPNFAYYMHNFLNLEQFKLIIIMVYVLTNFKYCDGLKYKFLANILNPNNTLTFSIEK